jgi:hypothetical protein
MFNEAASQDMRALLAIRRNFTGIEKLTGWQDLAAHRDIARCQGEGGVTLNSNKQVTKIELYNMGLSGKIPPEIGLLSTLEVLGLSGNQHTGVLPVEMGQLTSLTGVWLEGNQFTGEIPCQIGNLVNLRGLWLNMNLLSGPVPAEIGQLVALTELYLSGNQLTVPAGAPVDESSGHIWFGTRAATQKFVSYMRNRGLASSGHQLFDGIIHAPEAATASTSCEGSKFVSAGRSLVLGTGSVVGMGVLAAMGIPNGGARHISILTDGVAEITREFTTLGEHCDEADKERFDYVFNQRASLLVHENGAKRDVGNEGMTLDDFMQHPNVRIAHLSKAHVLALRLYTSNSYGRVNWPLRDGCTEAQPHPFSATAFYVCEAIRKLRACAFICAAPDHRVFWRGMADTSITEEFVKQGGTEMGCMSTTEDLAVARKFAKAGMVACALLLKVVCGGMMDSGADIQWLSMYPEEKEVLFPPLTYLLPIGEPVVEEGGVTIVTVQPRFCG